MCEHPKKYLYSIVIEDLVIVLLLLSLPSFRKLSCFDLRLLIDWVQHIQAICLLLFTLLDMNSQYCGTLFYVEAAQFLFAFLESFSYNLEHCYQVLFLVAAHFLPAL